MRIEHTGQYRDVINAARDCNATQVSIQQYWTFCNFATRTDAEAFNAVASANNWKTMGINTNRPYVPFEVAVSNPK